MQNNSALHILKAMSATNCANFQWLATGDAAFAAMLRAINAATQSIRLQTYIFADSPLGATFRAACIAACKRGVLVHVLVDAVGSIELSDDYWDPVREAGGHFRWFNRVALERFAIRDHRKILVCDETIGFVGGFNIAPEYEGDGVNKGWCDHGMQVTGPLAQRLAEAFDGDYARAEFRQKRFVRLRKSAAKEVMACPDGEILLSGPGLGRNPVRQKIHSDLTHARKVQIEMAYFLPSWMLRRQLIRVVKGGGRVQLLLAGKSDVPLSQLAGHTLYHRLLRAGIEIYEYQPQVLHAKLIIIDDVVYVGSANLDPRSLHINYELMIRSKQPGLADGARGIFADDLRHAKQIDRATWHASRNFLQKLRERWSHFLVSRVDLFIALRQLRAMR